MLVRPNAGEWAAKNPNKSDRAIAAEIGIMRSTVSRARRRSPSCPALPSANRLKGGLLVVSICAAWADRSPGYPRNKVPTSISTAASRTNRKTAPSGMLGLTYNRPLWASIIDRQIDRPMPTPSDFVVKSGLNIRSMSFGSTHRSSVFHRNHYAVRFVNFGFDAKHPRPMFWPPLRRLHS
jgi:hypothetical protein